MKFLAIYLRAPLQSWGAGSKFMERTTRSTPTISGLLGLVAAACGVDRENDAWLAAARQLNFSCYPFNANKSNQLRDFHTIGARHDPADVWQKRMIPSKAEGGAKGTVITHRDYLQDCVFGAVISGDADSLLEAMAEGLQNPRWGVWLGRKCCIPTEPVYAGLFDTSEEAHRALKARYDYSRSRMPNPKGRSRALGPDAPDEPDKLSVMDFFNSVRFESETAEEQVFDLPLSFAQRTYQARRIVPSSQAAENNADL